MQNNKDNKKHKENRVMIDLDGKVAVVTGAARGLGEAIARQLCAVGAVVVLTDVLVNEGKSLSQRLNGTGYTTCFIRHDVTSCESWSAVIDTALDRYGRMDYLVNNAGINIPKNIEDAEPDEFQSILNVNLMGAFLGMKAVIPAMKSHGGGAIVNIASNSTRKIMALTSMYSASKAALANLTKTTAVHLAETGTGIRVNSVHPGPHATQMILGGDGIASPAEIPAVKQLIDSVPMKRLGQPAEVASLVVFLLSDAAAYMTAEDVYLDGGLSVV